MKTAFLVCCTIALSLYCGCSPVKVSTRCGSRCERATLYYLPDCKEIKGYVNFQESGLQRVFQQEIPKEFRADSITVCLKYRISGVGILMSDCLQSEVIEIKCIKKEK